MSIITIKPRVPTTPDVNTERDRRTTCQPFTVTGYEHTIIVLGDAEDRQNLLALGTIAGQRVAVGDDTPIPYRDASNVVHSLTPAQMHELWMKGAELITTVAIASWEIKDDPEGISPDFKNDPRWP